MIQELLKYVAISVENILHAYLLEENVRQEFAINMKTSLRASERVLGAGRSTIMHMLHKDMQHSYHFQKVQALCADDYCILMLVFATAGRTARFSIVDFVFR